MPVGLYRRNRVANASERLHQLSNDNRLNDQTINGQRLSKPALAYAERICWIKGIYSFLAISCRTKPLRGGFEILVDADLN